MTTYLYKLGHTPSISIAEFKAVTKEVVIEVKNSFIVSTKDQDIQKMGSIVFRALQLKSSDFEGALSEISKLTTNKKLSLCGIKAEKPEIIRMSKQFGFKKIHITNDSTPSFGDFKRSKQIISYSSDVGFYLITEFFNQEFWAKLDENLPSKDMKRGITNLKLARTMLNFTTVEYILDPFAGLARNPIAGLDLKKEFLYSDIDIQASTGAHENIDYANYFYGRYGTHINSTTAAKVNALDFKSAETVVLPMSEHTFAVVTEGWLGKNFSNAPTLDQAKGEFEKVMDAWKGALKNFERQDIHEIVLCLPFYPKLTIDKGWYVSEFKNLISSTKYHVLPFDAENEVLYYSRKDTVTGHMIVKVTL
jgi:hypothetical protein